MTDDALATLVEEWIEERMRRDAARGATPPPVHPSEHPRAGQQPCCGAPTPPRPQTIPEGQPSPSPRDRVISFGMHQGKQIRDLPTDYLRWVAEKAENVPPDLRAAVAQELRARDRLAPATGTGGRHDPPAAGTAEEAQPNLPAESVLVSAAELAGLLSISLRSVWRMRKDGRLPPPLRLGRQTLRWDRREIMEMIATGWIGRLASQSGPAPGRNGETLPTDDNR
jgi:predicted DNA-binding transcriptional regulator AlpA